MFGFPTKIEDFGLKYWIRLVIIVCCYVLVRPLFEALFKKLGERARRRQARQHEEKMARQFKQQRIREKLGIEDDSVEVETSDKAVVSGSKPSNTKASSRKAASTKSKSKSTKSAPVVEPKTEEVHQSFDSDSDEDVSDLMPPSAVQQEAANSI